MDSSRMIKQEEKSLDEAAASSLPSKSNRKRKQKTISSESADLSNYQKKHILAHLKTNGCTKDEFQNIALKFRTDYKSICNNFNKCIKEAEENVHEECDSQPFNSINQWLELLKDTKINETCYYEAAAVINSIANNEPQPPIADLGGIDLKELYGFLGKALLGQPQDELKAPSAEFLAKEFQLLIDEVNSDVAKYDTPLLQQTLRQNTANEAFNYAEQPYKCSFDPLMVDDVME